MHLISLGVLLAHPLSWEVPFPCFMGRTWASGCVWGAPIPPSSADGSGDAHPSPSGPRAQGYEAGSALREVSMRGHIPSCVLRSKGNGREWGAP